jgi:hypothetical protein
MSSAIPASIFLDMQLPNATTWFYFSALLAVALFFKFSRLLSIRNLDVLCLFLLMPGLLLLLESHGTSRWGYLWLLSASGIYLGRCLIDLVLERRPALSPNLNVAGLAWLAGSLFVSLVTLAVWQPGARKESNGQPSTMPDDAVRKTMEKVLSHTDLAANGQDVNLWVERGLMLLCHLSIVVGMVLIGRQHFVDVHAGMAAATCYLLLPYTYLLMPSTALGVARWDHAWPMAWMIWAVLAYRRPMLAGLFLGLAAASMLFPLLTVPVWLSFYWKRGSARFALAFILSSTLCLALLAGLVWLNNGVLPHPLQSAWAMMPWQPWGPLPAEVPSFWQAWSQFFGLQGLAAYRIPVFIAFAAFVVTTVFWPAPKNLAHVLALCSAILLGIQFWYADHGGVYVLWYLPFLLLLVFRPNLSHCRPPPGPPNDWLQRLGRWLLRPLLRLVRLPEPATRVSQP